MGPFHDGLVEVSLQVTDEPCCASGFFDFCPLFFSRWPERFEILGEAVIEQVQGSVCHWDVIFDELRERAGALYDLTVAMFNILDYLREEGLVAARGGFD